MLTAFNLIHIDQLSLVMLSLVGFVVICVATFSFRYLEGDRKQSSFYKHLSAIMLTVTIMVCADHLLLLLCSWTISNLILVRMMCHKNEWQAARYSSLIAFKNFCLGFLFLAAAFVILYKTTGETSLQLILKMPIEHSWQAIASILILLAAMTQSSLWPFHRWLTSSLNSPTPVSAIMHAGLVNGGGFLLARFAPLFANEPNILNFIFVLGIITAMLGTLWKLMQSDVKRMLACSTLGQMGYMVAQCGLGLFPAAVAHLCWHGLFKAYLFLSSGSAAEEKRLDLDYPPSLTHFLLSLLCGFTGAYLFTLTSNKHIFSGDTTSFLIILSMVTGTQFALPIIRKTGIIQMPLALLMTAMMGMIYGGSVFLIEIILAPLDVSYPQELNLIHVMALAIMMTAWLSLLFIRRTGTTPYPNWLLKAYIITLNASQPNSKTITAHRNHYQF